MRTFVEIESNLDRLCNLQLYVFEECRAALDSACDVQDLGNLIETVSELCKENSLHSPLDLRSFPYFDEDRPLCHEELISWDSENVLYWDESDNWYVVEDRVKWDLVNEAMGLEV